MSIVSSPPTAGNLNASQYHPQRVAAAHRRHHEAQVGLSCGEANSLATDEAEAAYRDSVADATAATAAKVQKFVEMLRLTAEDETGLRELAGRYLSAITGQVPADTAKGLADVVASARDTRRELAAQGVELLGAVNGVAAARAELAKLQAAVAAMAARIAVKS